MGFNYGICRVIAELFGVFSPEREQIGLKFGYLLIAQVEAGGIEVGENQNVTANWFCSSRAHACAIIQGSGSLNSHPSKASLPLSSYPGHTPVSRHWQ